MTEYELANLKVWFDRYIIVLEEHESHNAAKITRIAFDFFLGWMENSNDGT